MSNHYKKSGSQSGAAIVETLLVFPVMMLLGLGIVHLGLVYQAKANLEYAALMAARVGAVTSVDIDRMRQEVADRMAPSRIGDIAATTGSVDIDVINPTFSMFQFCGEEPLDNTICNGTRLGRICQIPNFGLQYRSPSASSCGNDSTIQDANILRIKVTYRFDSRIPFMNMRLFPGDSRNVSPSGVDITAIATVRMQTPAQMTAQNEGYFL